MWSVIKWFAGAIVAGLITVYGIAMLTDEAVTCGGEVMHEGDTCFTSTRRSSSVNDFDEQAAANERQAWFMIVVGSIGTVGSLAGCVSAGRRRFDGRESVAL